jgi:methionyl-tRNA formyltransferase
MGLRLVMVGAVAFSRTCLETLIRIRAPLSGVASLHSRAAARHSDYADLAPIARGAGVEVMEVADINARETCERLRAWVPDALLILGWSQLLKPPLLAVSRIGAIGSHPALLPRNPGRHPVIWQLIHGEPEPGLSLFWLDESADGGPILLQERFALSPEDDAGTVYAKMTDAGVRMLPEAVRLLETDHPPRLAQDPSQATYLRKRTERDGVHLLESDPPSGTFPAGTRFETRA